MSNYKFTEYNLPSDAYTSFDALTLRDFIIKRLNEEGTFKDQVYEGSNLSAIIEIIAYSYHVLLFYLNTTASEASFNQASVYESMNKIVNLIGYKPTGKQTSVVPLRAVASPALPQGNYLIRRFSYFLTDGIQYTFLKDYDFAKITAGESEALESINNEAVLYQGTVEQYPVYTASGEEFETLAVVVDNIVDSDTSRFISEGSITVFVHEQSQNKYVEYRQAANLYLTSGIDRVYDVRLNENGNYEIKFGNNVFGRQLNEGDEVIVYYLLSNNTAGIISINTLSNDLFRYSTPLFENIYGDVKDINSPDPISRANSSLISFTNPINSTILGNTETVDQMRSNVPAFVASNWRLITARDYKTFLEKNLSNIAQSIYVASNEEYLNEYINYFYQISVDPTKVNRVLLNQVNFADSCDFNNVNVFCVPTTRTAGDNEIPDFIPVSFKKLIVDLTKPLKGLTAEVVPRDPVYISFKFGITNQAPRVSTGDVCKLVIVRNRNNLIQKEVLKNRAASVILDYFNIKNCSLGQIISISTLTSKLLEITGIKSIQTINTQENITYNGISLLGFNSLYPDDDIFILNQDTKLNFFKFPFLAYPESLINYINIIDE